MPAYSTDFYLQDARNNFDSVRPAPVCPEVNQTWGLCQNVHISTNCYYGYHGLKNTTNNDVINDCEMQEVPAANTTPPPQTATARKRSAENTETLQIKRLRRELQRKKTIEPETSETMNSELSAEQFLESLYWNTHGGNLYHLK